MNPAAVLAPVSDQQESENHAAQMREVGYAVGRSSDSRQKFDGSVNDYEPFGFDREEEIQIYRDVGEAHSESQQYSEYGPGGSDGYDLVDIVLYGERGVFLQVGINFPSDDSGLDQSRTYSGDQIIGQEPLAAPEVFESVTEHPEGEHVEEKVRKIAVHEHIGQELPRIEIFRTEVVQAEPTAQVDAPGGQADVYKEKQDIEDQQILYHRGKKTESLYAIVVVR